MMYVCMYVCVTLENAIISRGTRKRSITCDIVTLFFEGKCIILTGTQNTSNKNIYTGGSAL